MAGAASASLTAFGAWPGETAKVVEGVSAIIAPGRGRDEALRAPMRRQGQPQVVASVIGLDLEPGEALRRQLLACAGVAALQPDELGDRAVRHHPLRGREGEARRRPPA